MTSPSFKSPAELQETVHQLRAQLGVEPDRAKVDRLQWHFKISRSQAIILAVLSAAGCSWVPLERLDMALPDRGDDPRDPKTVLVFICRLRKALGEDSIICMRDAGYTLGSAGVLAVRRALEPAQ